MNKKVAEIDEFLGRMNTSSTEYQILREGFKVDQRFQRSFGLFKQKIGCK